MIGWVLLSREAVARAEEALASNEKGVRDEVGFLALHQGFADRFFPGTSVLHTRLRYVLFVPWLMEKIAADTATDITRKFSDAETALAGQLKACPGPDPDGIIGGRVWTRRTAQPPSMAYWTALGSWGILRQQSDGSLPSRTQTLRRLARRRARLKSRLTDDGGVLDDDTSSPFVSLPRVTGQAHDRVPQLGEAFSQILHVSCGFAYAGPCFRQEPAGIGPASRACVEVVFVAWGCERIEHAGLHGCKAGWRGRRGK